MMQHTQIKYKTPAPSLMPGSNRLLSSRHRSIPDEMPASHLLPGTPAFIEPGHGHDFAKVAVHKDAQDSSQALQSWNNELPQIGPSLPASGGAGRGPCDDHHINDLINPAFAVARTWRQQTLNWLEAHLAHLRSRANMTTGDSTPVGTTIVNELRLLDQHFGISRVIAETGSIFPRSPNERVNIGDIEHFGQASGWIRQHFREVELSSLAFQCQPSCPRRRGGTALATTDMTSSEITFNTNCFDRQHEKTRAGVAMHEAFHASFSGFDHDTYSNESDYPGNDPLTNAESFSTFSAIAATGSGYRITLIQDLLITGSP